MRLSPRTSQCPAAPPKTRPLTETPGQACGDLPPASPLLVAQPGQLSPGFCPESFSAELEEGSLVSSSQLLSPQALLRHGQAEAAEGAGASIVPADLTPLGTDRAEHHSDWRTAVRVAKQTKKQQLGTSCRPAAELGLPGCPSWPGHCSLQSHLLHQAPHGEHFPEVTTDSRLGGCTAAPHPLPAGILRRGRFKITK